MSEDKTYNGWTNYETWLVNLWLTNDEYGYDQLLEDAKEADDLHGIKEIIEGYVEAELEMLSLTNGLMLDLIRSALGAVDWYAIARHVEMAVEETEDEE